MAWSNYATICRLCLQQDGFLLAIFNNHSSQTNTTGTDNRSIQKKIAECTALEVSSGDGLPPCVCHRCLYKVELCLEFRQQCIISDATLRQITGQLSARNKECNGEGGSDHESEEYQSNQTIVPNHQFEQFTSQNHEYMTENTQNIDSVVMVVDPTMDYDSENDSECGQQTSDTENTNELAELKNVFMCKYCDKAYTIREDCLVHESTDHNNDVPFRCSSCDMGFGDRSNYTAHQKSVHGNDKPFGCPQCQRSFSRRSDLRKHTVVHTGIKPFTCNICFKSFSRNTNLTKHLRIHSGHKPYICPQCPKTFISKGDLTRHAIIHTGQKPYSCNYCDQSFGRRDKLIRHEKRHFPHNGGGDQAATLSELELLRQQLSMNSYYGNETEVVKQEIEPEEEADDDCDQESWNGENMVINVDPFSHENYSGATSAVKEEGPGNSELQSPDRDLPRIPDHLENTDELPRVPEHITADSYRENFETNNIKKQIQTVSAIKKYPCLICHKRFSSADTLRFHTSTHSGKKPHSCNLCSKAFLRKRELDRHMATHTGMKPFKCMSCDKRFGRKDKLVRHMRIHDGNKAHVCTVCGATFTRKDGLVHHMKTHTSPEQQSSC